MTNQLQSLFEKRIVSVEESLPEGVSSINNRIALGENGIYFLRVGFADGSLLDCVRKVKSPRIIRNGIRLISGKNARFTLSMTLHKKILGYNKSCTREISLYKHLDRSLRRHMPVFYGSFFDRRSGLYSLILRRYFPVSDGTHGFSAAKRALNTLLDFHIFYYNREDQAKKLGLNICSPKDYRRSRGFIRLLFRADEEENRRYFSEQKLNKIERFIDKIHLYAAKFSHHRSFSHNDFSHRNIFFTENKTLIYDFELAAFQNPEHDLIELLIYEAENLSRREILELIEYHKSRLSPHAPPLRGMDGKQYKELLLFNAYEFIVIRLSLLRIAGKVLGEGFVDSLLSGADKLTEILEEDL